MMNKNNQDNIKKISIWKQTEIGIVRLWSNKGLLLLPTIYIIGANIGWYFRREAYRILPFANEFVYSDKVDMGFDFVILVLLILILWWIVIKIGELRSFRYDDDYIEQGFVNKKGIPPTELSKKKNHNKLEDGIKWEFLANNIKINRWQDDIINVEQVLDANINYLDYAGITKKRIVIKGVPTRYYKPAVLTTTNDWLCNEKHSCFIGETGSGKSYAMLTYAGKLALYKKTESSAENSLDTLIMFIDPKGDDENFTEFLDHRNYYLGIERAVEGINKFYKEFCYRRDTRDKERKKQWCYLFVDEYSTLLNTLDKKASDDIKNKMSNMLSMARSYNMRICIGLQFLYSDFLDKNKGNLTTIITLGTMDKTQLGMTFSRYKEKMTKECGQGEGYIYRSGIGLEELKVAKIENMEQITDAIKHCMKQDSWIYPEDNADGTISK